MRLASRFLSAASFFVLTSATVTPAAQAQSAQAVAANIRISAPVDSTQSTRLQGHIPAWANAANDRGTLAADTHLDNLHLILNRAPQVQAAFEQLLADQQNPSSPRYHQWLTPQQNATQYGIAASDLAAVTTWLRTQGLNVDDVAAGGVFITFSGSASAVQNAFATTLHTFAHDGLTLRAPTQEPAIPAAFTGLVQSVAGLDDTRLKPHNTGARFIPPTSTAGTAQPFVNSSTAGVHFTGPGDFNTIYDVNAALTAGTTGSGVHVLVLGYSRVVASDITAYENFFTLGVITQPTTYLLAGSTDPGTDGVNGWQGENTLDIQRIIGTAPGAAVDFSIASTSTYSNTFSQLQYNINTLNDPIVSMSFGSGESTTSNSTTNSFNTYFQTGAAQGIGNYISSGDTGAAGNDTNGSAAPASQYLTINVICGSGYATCVGGTEFADTASPSAYWASTNSSKYESALGYIPEGAWNDISTSVVGGVTEYEPAASGGGVSRWITKPTWQTGTGVPADGYRDSPDVSFTASGHDGYVLCIANSANQGACDSTGFYVVGGTSASAPSMAGVAALLNQKLGKAQGNLNPILYSLAASSPSVFHDTTIASSGVTGCALTTPSMCNNSDPATTSNTGGLAGYLLTTGYDQVTGLGSIDVNKLLTAASITTTSTTLALTTVSPNPAVTNQTVTLTATLTPSTSTATPTGTVTFYSGTTQIGTTTPSISTTSPYTATLTTIFATAGTYNITATYSGDTNFATSTTSATSLVVNTSSYTVTPATSIFNLTSGATTNNTDLITLSSVNNFAGTLALTCAVTNVSGTAAGTCSLSPTSATLTAGSSSSSTLTINTTAGTSGSLNVTVTGTSGTAVVTSSNIAINLVTPGFTITPSATPIAVISGATTGNTSPVSVAPTTGFTGTVALTCTAIASGTVTGLAPACTATSVTITGTTAVNSTVTLTSTPGSSGTYLLSLSGTSGTITAKSASTLTATLTAASFTTAASPGTLTFTSGATTGNTSVITATSVNGFSGAVNFTCTVATLSGGYYPATCAVSPTSGALASGGTTSTTLTITSTTAHSMLEGQPIPFNRPLAIGGTLFATLLLVPILRRRRQGLRFLAVFALMLSGITALTGCGGSSTPAAPVTHSSSGSFVVSVNATGTTTGSATVYTAPVLSLTLNIN